MKVGNRLKYQTVNNHFGGSHKLDLFHVVRLKFPQLWAKSDLKPIGSSMSHQSSMYLTRAIKTNWFQINCEYYEFFTSVSDNRTQVSQPTKYFWIKNRGNLE